jgi:glycogen operon protein
VNFSTFTRTARQVELLPYEAADKPEPAQIIILDPDINRSYLFWHVFVHGLPAGVYYTWRIDGTNELVDPWAWVVIDSTWVRCLAASGVAGGSPFNSGYSN